MELEHESMYNPNYTIQQLLQKSLILLDKPPRISSHEATAFVKKILNVKKTGHSGTLDPNVSGVLIIAINKATRFLEYLNSLDKKYVCLMRLYKKNLKLEDVQKVVNEKFIGSIKQRVPEISAVRKQTRSRTIYSIKILEVKNNSMTTDVLFIAHVEKGTYIRVLCEDIGKELNCIGKMLELRRISVGKYDEENYKLTTLHELYFAYYLFKQYGNDKLLKEILKPIEFFCDFPKIKIKPEFEKKALHGDILKLHQLDNQSMKFLENYLKGNINNYNLKIGIFSQDNELICVAKISRKKNNVLIIPKKVFMELKDDKL
ncbi:MAG: RNA-guided pseudouridylation complex pseudouridine synthase subunit Cbf5 [Candidatus Aenigmatarchaeota archaeon]